MAPEPPPGPRWLIQPDSEGHLYLGCTQHTLNISLGNQANQERVEMLWERHLLKHHG